MQVTFWGGLPAKTVGISWFKEKAHGEEGGRRPLYYKEACLLSCESEGLCGKAVGGHCYGYGTSNLREPSFLYNESVGLVHNFKWLECWDQQTAFVKALLCSTLSCNMSLVLENTSNTHRLFTFRIDQLGYQTKNPSGSKVQLLCILDHYIHVYSFKVSKNTPCADLT